MSDGSHEDNEDTALSERFSYTRTLPWPAGLQNSHNVAVGVFSGTWIDDYREEPSTSLLTHLLRLPNIGSIYFSGLKGDDLYNYDDDGDWNGAADQVIPARCSSVKHSFLHGYDMTSDEFEELLTLAFNYDGKTELDGATSIVNSLAEFQGSGLQDLMWYGFDNDTLIGDHCCVHDTEELPSFKSMKKVSFSIQDLGLVADRASHKCDMDEDEFFIYFTATVFPETVETLILWDCPCSGHVSEQTGDTILLERAMIKLMTSGSYRKLKAVFLEDLERPRYGPRKDVLWFQEVVAAGATAGVDVNSLTNRKTMQHSIEFLEASDEYDLISGVHSGVRPSNWVFNPYIGKRFPPGCNRCGECQDCYLKYDAELWNGIRHVVIVERLKR